VDRAGDNLIRFQLLGEPAATRGGRRLPVPRGQAWALLAWLLEHRGQVIDRSALIEAIWADAPPTRAETVVRALLSRLRSALGEEVLHGRGIARVADFAGATVDAVELEVAGERALASPGAGPPEVTLAPLIAALAVPLNEYLPGADLPWIAERRTALADLRERCLELLARRTLGAQDAARARGRAAAQELMRHRPYNEAAAELVIRHAIADDRPAEAALVFDALRERLRDELGIAPGSRLRALHADLLGDGDIGEDPPRSGHLTRTPREARLSRALEVTAQWHAAQSLAELRELALRSWLELSGVDAVGWNEIDPPSGTFGIGGVVGDDRFMGDFATLARLIGEHPHVPVLTAGLPVAPLSWWDVTSERAMRRTEIYTDFFVPHGIGNQLNILIALDGPVAVLTANRRRGEFTADQRELARRLQPHLQSALAAVRARERAAGAMAIEGA
jgi:DNA-binding SARP family transcriptional activator